MYRPCFFCRLVLIALFFVLVGCAPGGNTALSNLPTATAFAKPFHAPSTRTPYPTLVTPEHQGNDEYLYCVAIAPPDPYPVSETQGLNEDEIAEKMMHLRLDYFSDPSAPDVCRIEEYKIDKISPAEPWMLDEGGLPPQSFLRIVDFSVKIHQLPEYWINLGSEIDLPDGYSGSAEQQNWLKTSIILVIYKISFGGQGDFYAMAQIRINP